MDKITLKVKECNEFETLGECHEEIKTVEEAIQIWNSIPGERMNGIKSIGLVLESKDDYWNGTEVDLLVGNHFNFEMLDYVPVILKNEQAQEMVKELMKKMPDMGVIGEVPEELRDNRSKAQEEVPRNKVKHHR